MTSVERPRDYSKGKIYKIQPVGGGEEGEIYIGSTTKQYLSQRMTQHNASYKSWKKGLYHKFSLYDIFDKYTVSGCEICLVESVNCNSNDELLAREKYHIQNNNCVNKYIPSRTREEYRNNNQEQIKELKKQYYANNSTLVKEKQKVYATENKDKIQESGRKYRIENVELIKERKKEYYQVNKHIINEKSKMYGREKVVCLCGSTCRKGELSKHIKTKKHLAFTESTKTET